MIDERSMILARDWQGEPLLGCLASEKLNGCRVEWDGEAFWTRHGNRVTAPEWFTRGLPRCRINGEIHAGRGVGFGNNNSAYKVASNAVRLGGEWFSETDDGHPLLFAALYCPEVSGNWQRRQRAAVRAVRGCRTAEAIKADVVRDCGAVARWLKALRAGNAEGGMFLRPEGDGECGRTGELLRIKFLE